MSVIKIHRVSFTERGGSATVTYTADQRSITVHRVEVFSAPSDLSCGYAQAAAPERWPFTAPGGPLGSVP